MNSLKMFACTAILAGCTISLVSQEPVKKDLAREFQEADLAFYFDKNYLRAASLYEPLLVNYPDNENIAAKLGICYLNIDGKKKEALNLLRKAVTNLAANDRSYVKHGEQAPPDTYMYLGMAWHLNDSLSQAVDCFYKEKKRLAGTDPDKDQYIDILIRDSRYAAEQKKKPLTVISSLFAPWLADYPGACNPVLAANGSVFIFTQKTGEKTRILCSYKNETWQKPVDITSQLGGLDRFYSNSITADGKLLVLYIDDGGDGNLYFSERKDTTWSRMRNPGRPLNTIYWESHGFITPDGNSIYLASNRPGGFGELDIWKADKKPDGTWNDPVNLGEPVNTQYNEDTPFFDPNNNALIFSSIGHISMGGYDVFRSVIRNGRWSNPVGMPYAFNTTGENTFFILNNNAPGFVASRYSEKDQARNIYAIVAIDPAEETTRIEGALTLKDGTAPDQRKATIRIVDILRKIPEQNVSLNEDGTYRFDVRPGDYDMLVSHAGYLPASVRLNIPLYFLSHYMAVNTALEPEKAPGGSLMTEGSVLFGFDSYALSEEAKKILESVKSLLTAFPSLKVEVAGYTDPKGSAEYNMKLAERRAQAVIDYLTSPSIPASRFIRKAFGETNFTALNTNTDGSDNPEGRKYNRRVAFGIVDPGTGLVIRQETYTPEHLRLVSSSKYFVVLRKSAEILPSSAFAAINPYGMQVIKTIKTAETYSHAVGVFYSKTDASEYLSFVKGKGFTDAYIVTEYEINKL
ncbi:MAG: OmpA family protein [Bacteroidales bacterium]|nr:OmpA family protein [Bacteroidales bacterium]